MANSQAKTEDPIVAKAFGAGTPDEFARAVEELSPDEAAFFLKKLEHALRKRKIMLSGYIVAMVALSFHIFHGAWAMFRSLGVTSPRVIPWTRAFAAGFALLILVGNVSMPLLITTGAVTK